MYWGKDWAWGLPLLVITVVIHICGLVLMQWAMIFQERRRKRPRSLDYFIVTITLIAIAATALHGAEAAIWAFAYVWLGASPDNSTALLYSLSAMTAYGHANIALEPAWRLLGAIEAMNGLILFGLTTAFLYSAIAEVRPVRRQ